MEPAEVVRCDPEQSVRQHEELIGPEDITIDHGQGIAYVSASDRWEKKSGGLFSYRPGLPGSLRRIRPAKASAGAQGGYFPHGISLYIGGCADLDCKGEQAVRRLLVIHHPVSSSGVRRSDVEILGVDGGKVRLVESIEGESAEASLGRPLDLNDLVAVGPRRFFASDNGAGLIASAWFGKGAIVYFDGMSWHEAVTGLRFPNGVAYQESTKTLYVGTSNGLLRVFDASDPLQVSEHRESALDLGMVIDNIEWESADRDALLIAAHDSALRFIWHRFRLADTSPSSIWRVGLDDEGLPDPRRTRILHHERGELLPAISVAALHGDRILLGSVFVDRFLDCEYSGRYLDIERETPSAVGSEQ